MAWLLVEPESSSPADVALALELANGALEKIAQGDESTRPDFVLDTLALAQFRSGDVSGAIANVRLAIEQLPESEEAKREDYAKRLARYEAALADEE